MSAFSITLVVISPTKMSWFSKRFFRLSMKRRTYTVTLSNLVILLYLYTSTDFIIFGIGMAVAAVVLIY